MRQFDTALLNILIGCLLLISNASFAQSSKTLPTKVVGFNLPDDQASGLVYCGFEITPELSLSRGNEFSSLHLRIKWQPSTAQSPKGGFQYRYRYNGKEYTDKMIGAQAFNSVRASSVSFEVVVSGESQMITTQMSDIGGVLRDSNGQIIQFSKEASIEGFNIQVIGLKRVGFRGTLEIIDKIREYNVVEQTKAIEASKASSNSTNSSTNVVANSNGSSTTNNTYSSSSNQHALNQNEKALSDFSREQQQKTEKFFQEKEDFNRSLASQNHLYSQSFYASQMASQAKDNLGQLTSFQGNYSSAEELEADFNAKFYAISREVENLNYARNEALNANVAIAFHGSDASGQAVGELIHSIGSLVNQNKAEKERKQAIEALRREREKMLAEIAEKKKSLTREMRKGIIDRFTEGGLPTSSHHMGASVYCFAYFFDESKIGDDFPSISITNVFEIQRYSDASWPLKSLVISQLKKLNSAKVTLVGYYSSAAAAEEMRTTLMNIAKKGDMKTGTSVFKLTGNSSNVDFWGNQKNLPISKEKNRFAILSYEEAEEAFYKNNFNQTLTKLAEAEKMLGQVNPRIMYLRIMSQFKLFESGRGSGFSSLEIIRENVDTYLMDYEGVALKDHYLEIKQISKKLEFYPSSHAAFEKRKLVVEFEKQIRSFKKNGDQSYKNYQDYLKADSIASFILLEYTRSDIGAEKYTEIYQLSRELKERYRWNKEYHDKLNQIKEWERLEAVVQYRKRKYDRTVYRLTSDSKIMIQAGLLSLGALSAMIGGGLMFDEQASWSGTEGSLVKFGLAGALIGGGWLYFDFKSVDKAESAYIEAKSNADAMKKQIGPLVDKMNESINERPIVNRR
ncbi:MAG: hypothetical protein JJU34_03045 [Lunatimonas sp.]|uniref:hypothetical protein n=1 Tax=Lunatimonas sp. TaxID=2060141 RepID=UPI00263B77CB|nr:hypothetical protein [Lunatimonas sp.]MCC5936238.1 hypothetical protein [Lunatimonas sp.]